MRTTEKAKNEWMYYHHALLPTCAPHVTPNWNTTLWDEQWEGRPLLARWTTEFDNKEYSDWWYVIKDDPFDITVLKSKRRNVINNGIKNFEIKSIMPIDFLEELFVVQIAAYSAYPAKYRPTVEKDSFYEYLKMINAEIELGKKKMLGAFDREFGKLRGYILVGVFEEYIAFNVLRSMPEFEKLQINAALVKGLLDEYNDLLSQKKGFYICDGERSINHETHFQEYLEKYFGFRKAYCKININYRGIVAILVKLLYPLKDILQKIDKIGIIHQVNSILKMEKIVRNQKSY